MTDEIADLKGQLLAISVVLDTLLEALPSVKAALRATDLDVLEVVAAVAPAQRTAFRRTIALLASEPSDTTNP